MQTNQTTVLHSSLLKLRYVLKPHFAPRHTPISVLTLGITFRLAKHHPKDRQIRSDKSCIEGKTPLPTHLYIRVCGCYEFSQSAHFYSINKIAQASGIFRGSWILFGKSNTRWANIIPRDTLFVRQHCKPLCATSPSYFRTV